MIKLFFTLSLLASINANAHNCFSLTELNWVLGKWQTQKQQPLTTERWTKLSDKTFEGSGRTGSSDESLRLVEMSGEIFYLAKVSHNPNPIAFKLTHCDNKFFTFTNNQHDFPTTIEYQQINNNTMQIKISGKSEKSFTIQLYRVEDNINNNQE